MQGSEEGRSASSAGAEDWYAAHRSILAGHPGGSKTPASSPAHSHLSALRGRQHETRYRTGWNTD